MSHIRATLTEMDATTVESIIDAVDAKYRTERLLLQNRLAQDAAARVQWENLGAMALTETAEAAYAAGKQAGIQLGMQQLLDLLSELAADRSRLQAISEAIAAAHF